MRKPSTPIAGARPLDRLFQHRLAGPAPGKMADVYTDAHLCNRPAESVSRPVRSLVKRSYDVLVATLVLIVLLPGIFVIALAIKASSPGPVLFRQRRYGLNNELFRIYKFRTMYINKGDHTGVRQTCIADERVTPIGRFLRRLNLDELPQLINVIKGDMSLVGPRPHVPGMLAAGIPYEQLVPNYFDRHRVKPGITGLAQARGLRGSTVDPELAKARIELDLTYIKEWSFWLDWRIMIETLATEFLKTGNGV